MIKKWDNVGVIKKIGMVSTIAVFGLITLSHFFVTAETLPYENFLRTSHLYYFFDFLSFLLIPVFAFVCQRIHLSKKKTILFLSFIIIAQYIVFSNLFKFSEYEDTLHIINIAKNGITSDEANYFARYPFQYGFVLIIRFFYYLFGETVYLSAFKIVAFLMYWVALYFVYKTCEILFAQHFNRTAFLLICSLWFLPIIFCNYVYGFSLGLSFSLIAVYCYFKSLDYTDRFYKILYFIGAMVLISVATWLKPNYLLITLAVVVHQLFIRKPIGDKFLNVFVVITVMIGQSMVLNGLAKVLDDVSLDEVIPRSAWVITGGPHFENCSVELTDYTLPGFHNGYDGKLDVDLPALVIEQQVDRDLKALIDFIIDNPRTTLNFYKDKLLLTWNNSDFLTGSLSFVHYQAQQQIQQNRIQQWFVDEGYPIYYELCNIGYLLLMVCFLVGIWYARKQDSTYFFCILLGGVFVYHLFAETKPSYVYPFVTMMIPMAVYGLSMLGNKICSMTCKKQSRVVGCGYLVIGIVLSFIYDPKTLLKPIYECYSDGSTSVILKSYHYYQIPFYLSNRQTIDAIEIRLEVNNEKSGILHTALLDDNGDALVYYDVDSDSVPSYGWISIPIDRQIDRDSSELTLQVFVDEQSNEVFTLHTGNPYGNFPSYRIDGFDQTSVADIKIMQSKWLPIQFYGSEQVPGFDIMSRQPYALKYYQ